jgi:hypothetical protein
MNNTKNILLVAAITSLLMGTSITPMQSYADQHKKTTDFKSSIKASSEVDKKSANQHLDQDNFCYRGDDCQQANQGQQIVGKDNEAKGFNDQSNNVPQSTTPSTTPSTTTPTNLNLATLGDQWWNWAASIDTTTDGNPFNDTTGALCDLGKQPGNLLFLVGTIGQQFTNGTVTGGHTGDVRTCNTPIPRETNIFFPLLNTECSTFENKNLTTVAELRACANDIINHVDTNSLTLIIDGVPSNQLVKRVQSGPDGFQLTIVPNNPIGVVNVTQPITTLAVSDGYWALLPANSLTPGSHTITFGGVAVFGNNEFRTLVTYNIVVI